MAFNDFVYKSIIKSNMLWTKINYFLCLACIFANCFFVIILFKNYRDLFYFISALVTNLLWFICLLLLFFCVFFVFFCVLFNFKIGHESVTTC